VQQFWLMPLLHSEDLAVQQAALREAQACWR
jgi:uncharacterized protein (DUF924 family)